MSRDSLKRLTGFGLGTVVSLLGLALAGWVIYSLVMGLLWIVRPAVPFWNSLTAVQHLQMRVLTPARAPQGDFHSFFYFRVAITNNHATEQLRYPRVACIGRARNDVGGFYVVADTDLKLATDYFAKWPTVAPRGTVEREVRFSLDQSVYGNGGFTLGECVVYTSNEDPRVLAMKARAAR